MNLKKARNIMKSLEGFCISATNHSDLVNASRAYGYLLCYEQIEPLVGAIEYAIYQLDAENEHVTFHLQEALAQWKEGQK